MEGETARRLVGVLGWMGDQRGPRRGFLPPATQNHPPSRVHAIRAMRVGPGVDHLNPPAGASTRLFGEALLVPP